CFNLCSPARERSKLAYEFARYLKIRGAWGASFSPDGRRISFLTEITGVPQVWEVGAEGASWPEQLTFYEERVTQAAYSPTENRLLFEMDAGGNERSQLYLLEGAEVTDLTRAPEAIHYFGGFSPDGQRIAHTATRRNGTDFDVFVQDPPDGEPETVWEVSGSHMVVDWTADGTALIVSRHHSNVNNDLYRLDLTTGEATLLTPHDGEARFYGANVTPDGGSIYLATDRDGEFLRLARLDLATLSFDFLTPDDWDVESVELSRDGRYLVASRNVDGYSDVMLFNGRGRRMPDPRIPEGIVGGFEFSPDSGRLAFTLTAPERNPDVWVLDLPEGDARRLTRSSTAGIPPRSFRRPRVVRYPSFDGRQIPALFHEPEKERAPVIINVHGGPESQARPAFAPVTQYLLNRGYAVFFPNVRGSTGYGKTYTHLDDVELRMDSVKDLAHAAYWLRERDHERIAVMGGSYGGFMVLAALTEYPDLWASGVDIVGIANLVTFLENTGSYRRHLREAEYGSLEKDRAFLASISPIHKAENITAPLMVVHGKNDPRVPVGEAEQIVERVRKNGGTVEYLLYQDEGHGLAKLKNRLDAYPRIAAFLEEHLAGRPTGH
ncbi:MAG TPA: S9 family peptidase, partial [Rubrobacter sp.]|nr:S9 family peptidase [Rubrobacter sp.]